jgi:hypothetical protein
LIFCILENGQFNKLNSFKIRGQIFEQENYSDQGQLQRTLLEKILNNENALETFECSPIFSSFNFNKKIEKSTINMNIHSLSMISIMLIDALPILKYTPDLKSYDNFSTTTIRYKIINRFIQN